MVVVAGGRVVVVAGGRVVVGADPPPPPDEVVVVGTVVVGGGGWVVVVVGGGGANAGEAVGGHRDTSAASAEQNAPVGAASHEFCTQVGRHAGVVNRIATVGAYTEGIMPGGTHGFNQCVSHV